MPGIHKKASHLLFAIVVIALAVFKWHDFYLPYFWDELGVYTQAADYQLHNQISLMPASVPPVFSRGHPLLFTFINASTWYIFGEWVFTSHLFCFFISVLLLLAVYLKISRYFDPVAGILSVVVLAAQPVFLAQSALVLPEITLSLLIFLALCSYYENRFLLFALFASLALLTKEVAVVLPAAVISYSILSWLLVKTKPQALKLKAIVLSLIPYLVFGIFLLVQKKQNGWYFFPLHMDNVSFNISTVIRQMGTLIYFIFCLQGRGFASGIIVAGAIFALLSGKWRFSRMGHSFLLLLLLLAAAFACLCSLVDLYMERYLVMLIVVFSIMAGISLAAISKKPVFVTVVIIILLGISSQHLECGRFDNDGDLGYRRELNTVQQGVTYLVEIAKPGEKMYCNFPAYYAFTFPHSGYIHDAKAATFKMDTTGIYYLLLCDPGGDLHIDPATHKMELLKQFDDGYAHSAVYRVKKL